MHVLASDSNILIDFEDGELITSLFRLPYEITTPDIVFESELRSQYPNLREIGLKTKSLTPKSVELAEAFF